MSSPEQDKLKAAFTSQLGASSFHEGWSSLLRLDPAFFAASLHLSSVPRTKSHLPAKEQALIGLAVDCASTHLYSPGIRAHITTAAGEGATVDEVLEVIELSSTLGIHACNIGVPLLVEVLREHGGYEETITKDFDAKQEDLRKRFEEKRGYYTSMSFGRTSSGSTRSSSRRIWSLAAYRRTRKSRGASTPGREY